MPLMGKLSTTNGVSIAVKPILGLTDQQVKGRLLLNNGKQYFAGPLLVTKSNFINAPRREIEAWIDACGRSIADIRGRANARNEVHFFRDDGGWFNIHFSELASPLMPAGRLAPVAKESAPVVPVSTTSFTDTRQALATPKAIDLNPLSANRIESVTYRILRDTQLARFTKELHAFECQICGHTIVLPNGKRYAETHHIQPLGTPHNGPDVFGNTLCVCPNHHAELDYGVLQLSSSALRQVEGHSVAEEYIQYHNTHIYGLTLPEN